MSFEGMVEWSVTLGKLLEGVLTVSSKGFSKPEGDSEVECLRELV